MCVPIFGSSVRTFALGACDAPWHRGGDTGLTWSCHSRGAFVSFPAALESHIRGRHARPCSLRNSEGGPPVGGRSIQQPGGAQSDQVPRFRGWQARQLAPRKEEQGSRPTQTPRSLSPTTSTLQRGAEAQRMQWTAWGATPCALGSRRSGNHVHSHSVNKAMHVQPIPVFP